MQLKSLTLKSAVFTLAALSVPAFAAVGGTANIQSKLETIKDILANCGVAIICGAIIWAGYKIVYLGNSLQEVKGPLIGGAIVGSAMYFTNLLLA